MMILKQKIKSPQAIVLEDFFGAPEWDRTTDLQFRKLSLYPTELRKQQCNNNKIMQ